VVDFEAIRIKDEMKFARKLSTVPYPVKNKSKILYNKVLWHLVFKTHVTIKWRRLTNDQTIGASMLQ
jgi:hypothetical protein